jgi:long-chain fatty acid transport protein
LTRKVYQNDSVDKLTDFETIVTRHRDEGQIMNNCNQRLRLLAAAIGLSVLVDDTRATEGYLQAGYGAVQKSLAGVGVADSEDATAIAINPAGLVDVGQQFNGSVTFFSPFPQYTGIGTGFITPGEVSSNHNFFPVPTLAYSQPLDGDSAVGIAVYGNGGLDTSYDIFNPNTKSQGVFGTGVTGVDLIQTFISVGNARRFGNVSVGVAPFVVVQRFTA